MNNKFDELTKSMAQSVTRRQAFKKFGLGIVGMALAGFGVANKAQAGTYHGFCDVYHSFSSPLIYTGACVDPVTCIGAASADCPPRGTLVKSKRISLACGGVTGGFDQRARCSYTI